MPTIIREHRGGLAESLASAQTVESRAELFRVVKESLAPYEFGEKLTPDMVSMHKYGYDARIGWDTWVITIKEYGVWGFSKGNIPV